MAQIENPATQIESALANGNFGLVLRIADKLVATSKRSLLGWVSRARANLGLGRICDADEDLDVAIRLAPDDAQANLLRGMVDQRLGRIDEREDIEDKSQACGYRNRGSSRNAIMFHLGEVDLYPKFASIWIPEAQKMESCGIWRDGSLAVNLQGYARTNF